MKIISLIAAIGKNREIGNKGALPWSLPADLAYFRKTTSGHPIIMGRRTHESIGRALPNRQNIVVTRQLDYRAKGCEIARSMIEAIGMAEGDEVFVIGGAEIYGAALPFARRIYLTYIDKEFPADTYFPKFDENEWREVSRTEGILDDKNTYPHAFAILERVAKPEYT